MRKSVTICGLFIIFFLIPFFLLSHSKEEKFDKSEGLKREIRLINLLKGLELNSEQMKLILTRARETERLRLEFETALHLQQSEREQALEEIKSHLQDNREIPTSTTQRFHRIQTELKRSRLNMEKKIKEKAEEIQEILEEHQIYQLQEFIPCIIPPEGESRIGQAEDHKGFARGIERMRSFPYRLYEKRKDEIVARTLERMKLHAPPRIEINEEEMKRHIRSVFEKARSLKDVEFEIQKDKLAEELISPLKTQTLTPNSVLIRKIKAFLLSPEIIPLLEERVESEDKTVF